MAMKAKAAGILVGIIGLLGVGVAMAASGDKKTSKPSPKPKPSPSSKKPKDEELDDDSTESDNDVAVETPEGEDIVIDVDEAEEEADADPSEEVFPVEEEERTSPETPTQSATEKDSSGSQGTPVDNKLAEEAMKTGTDTGDAIAEVVQEVTGGQGASPIAKEETSPDMDPHGTVALARILLAREELPNWKNDLKEDIAEWQENVDLTADGLFGVKSVERMAEEVGLLPLVRYWSKGLTTKSQAEAAYDSAVARVIQKLRDDLPDSQAQIEALEASMNREEAVSFGNSNPEPQDTREWTQDVNDAIAESAELRSEKELKS